MENQQLPNLNNNQLQVLLSARFGDGHIRKPKTSTSNSLAQFSSVHAEYLDYKADLLGDLCSSGYTTNKNGFAQKKIHTLYTKSLPEVTQIQKLTVTSTLKYLDELGLALWFYDDGSLHKRKLFYNLNTHSISKETQELYIIPFLKKFNIHAKLTKEVKKDGREFYYLRIGKFDGAYEISKILRKYYVSCFDYKIWSSETTNLFGKLQAELKRKGAIITKKHMSLFLNRALKGENVQDIVRSLEKSNASTIRWVDKK